MWNTLSDLEKIGFIFILMGSIVDLVQFSWIIKSWFTRSKRALYERVKKEVLLQNHQFEKHLKDSHKENFPGIKTGDKE